MRCSQLVPMLKQHSLLLSLLTVAPLVAVILGLTACVRHPVGDPEKSKVDPDFAGAWLGAESDSESLLIMRPYDSRTYLAHFFNFRRGKDGIQPDSREDYKAWLTVIGGETFITLDPLSFGQFTGTHEEHYYLVAQLSLIDRAIHLRIINGDEPRVKQAKDRHELEAVIAENVKSDSLYVSPVMVYAKSADHELLDDVIVAFTSFARDTN